MSHPVNDSTSEAGATVGSYEPRNMVDIRGFTQSTPDQLKALAAGYSAVGNRLAETPAGGGVSDSYSQIGAHLSALADSSGEISGQLAAYNASDFERIDNPRPNEHMADYGENTAG
ncbi:MAG TPA: hypothetical protein VGN37_11495 [Actinocatenispora sp.]